MPSIRFGKTARDRKNNAHATILNNRAQRNAYVAWCRSSASVTAKPNFPLGVCNGKKSRALRAKRPAHPCPKGGATRRNNRHV